MKKTYAFDGDAFAVFKKFYGKRGLFFLDSSRQSADARFSYLGFSPVTICTGTKFDVLRRALKQHRTATAVGYIGYEGGYGFGFYDSVISIDHLLKKLSITAPTAKAVDAILDIIRNAPPHVPVIKPLKSRLIFKSNFNKASYEAAVRKALVHIRKGDIYQINLSRKVEAQVPGWPEYADPVALYGALRLHSPSPFAAYFDDGKKIILSSSPERFLKLTRRNAQVKPMKGTRPRGKNKSDDARLKAELLKSPKEIAELLMVTDLERNDLGRVCAYGSVNVTSMRTIETYQTVFQATATIEGRLRKDRDVVDLLEATFPSGSVTGCPKIEAMKVIKNLEKTPRGLYTGALGYIAPNGDMDLSVLIRTLFLEKEKISFHVGGGIVADSKPAAEYEETCVKAKAMELALSEVFNTSLRGA